MALSETNNKDVHHHFLIICVPELTIRADETRAS